jgi:hypothetical protein
VHVLVGSVWKLLHRSAVLLQQAGIIKNGFRMPAIAALQCSYSRHHSDCAQDQQCNSEMILNCSTASDLHQQV